jgi:hypothetical protein
MNDERDSGAKRCGDLRDELLSRRDVDQASRSAFAGAGQEAVERLIQIDDDNAAWLGKLVDAVGWPGRSLVGEEGAHAAWLLAQHADRHPSLQRRFLVLLEKAVNGGEASPTDLAYLTDRVLLASGKLQVYGTQITARDGRFVACRLRNPETVDDRRASVGLGSLETYLRSVLDLYGSPSPTHMPCPSCNAEIEVWLPEMGGQSTVKCPSCHSVTTIRARMRSGHPPPQSMRPT